MKVLQLQACVVDRTSNNLKVSLRCLADYVCQRNVQNLQHHFPSVIQPILSLICSIITIVVAVAVILS